MFSTRLIIGVVIVFLLWNTIISVTFYMYQGPDVCHVYDMGNGYELWMPPYFIYCWIPESKFKVELVIDEVVEEFALVYPWIIGKTDKGLFAVNKEKNKVINPVPSTSELEAITGLNVSEINMQTNPEQNKVELLVYPRTRKAIANVKKFLIVIPVLLAFIPNIWGFLIRRKIKNPKGAKQ